MSGDGPEVGARRAGAVRHQPEPEVLAAIVAAVDATWPRPGPASADEVEPSRWRFSARWWSRPAASHHSRPW